MMHTRGIAIVRWLGVFVACVVAVGAAAYADGVLAVCVAGLIAVYLLKP